MKIKIDYQLRRMLRKNLVYILTFTILVVSLVISIIVFFSKFNINNDKISSLKSEINGLNKKKELINFKNEVIKGEVDLDKINSILTFLIPNEEDYFSIITALDRLSAQTNFIITSYDIILANSTPNQLSIQVEGQGDPNTFIEFLKNYNFSGGRVITLDQVNFSSGPFSGTKINLNFYSGKGTAGQELSNFTDKEKKLISTVLDKVNIDLKTEEEILPLNYPTKQNPF